jgi:hypothetical protein
VGRCQGEGIGAEKNYLRCFRHSHGGTGCGSAHKPFLASRVHSLALRGPYPQTHTCIPPTCASLDEFFTFLTRRYAIQHQTMPLGFLVFSCGDKVCCFVFKMKAKGGRAWREVMPDSYRKKQRGAIRDLANLWRLTRNRKLKQEMGARQVHLDSGTYRNEAGPTHFHQCGALLFSLF